MNKDKKESLLASKSAWYQQSVWAIIVTVATFGLSAINVIVWGFFLIQGFRSESITYSLPSGLPHFFGILRSLALPATLLLCSVVIPLWCRFSRKPVAGMYAALVPFIIMVLYFFFIVAMSGI